MSCGKELPVRKKGRIRAFTFVEIVIALAIVSICLPALIRLHLIGIRASDTAETITEAVSLANEKITSVLLSGYPKRQNQSGQETRNTVSFEWKTEVTDLKVPELDKAGIRGLRKVSVAVSWKQGLGRKQIQMSSYVAEGKIK